MAKAKLMEYLDSVLTPYFRENGYSLWYKEFVKEGKNRVLRIYAEKYVKAGEGEDNPEGEMLTETGRPADETNPGAETGRPAEIRIPVDTDDCEKISRYLSERLDADDPIEENYILEVSSPGMDRELRTREHYIRMIGESVDVSLYKPLGGEKKGPRLLTGILEAYDGKTITVSGNEIPLDQVAKTCLTVIF